jgi:predicted esterase
VTADFGGHPLAYSPYFDGDLLALHRALDGYGGAVCIFDGTNLSIDPYNHYFLPAGYRVARNLVFFELDKHGSYGTKERVLKEWNTNIKKRFDVPALTHPDEMYNPDGSPLDYKLYLDIIYPSQPKKKLPLWLYNSTQSINMRCFRTELNYPHMYGFAMRGYVVAIKDHCWNPLARHWSYGFFKNTYSLMDWNGLKSMTASVRFLRAHADRYGIDPNLVCAWGYSKGSYGVTRLSDPTHESQAEYSTFSGFPAGSPEPQPWQGYSSKITASYQAVGNALRRPEYITTERVPTVTACGKFDHLGFWPIFPPLVQVYESRNVNHLAIWMQELGHELPYGFDPWHDRDRYEMMMQFFDQYLKPEQSPEVLYILPINGRNDVTEKGYSQAIPDLSLLPDDALNYVSFREPITVHFGQPMKVSSIQKYGIRIVRKSDNVRVAGQWAAIRGDTVFQFQPAELLLANTWYRVIVTTDAVNQKGKAILEQKSIEFKTQ